MGGGTTTIIRFEFFFQASVHISAADPTAQTAQVAQAAAKVPKRGDIIIKSPLALVENGVDPLNPISSASAGASAADPPTAPTSASNPLDPDRYLNLTVRTNPFDGLVTFHATDEGEKRRTKTGRGILGRIREDVARISSFKMPRGRRGRARRSLL